MKCKFCGRELPDNSRFCAYCTRFLGEPATNIPAIKTEQTQLVQCSSCGKRIDPSVKFCPYCGHSKQEEKKETATASCKNCGHPLAPGAKFCFECGANVNGITMPQIEQRKTVYDGEIHKCPNCGDILDAHELICETCGYERRGTTNTQTIQKFVNSINSALTEENKADIIRNYPIPNNKEDIFEFLILASSNIVRQTNKSVFDAWVTKIEQCYQKAKVSYLHAPDYEKIQTIYDDANKRIVKERRRLRFSLVRNIIPLARKALAYPVLSLVFVGVCVLIVRSIVSGEFVPGHILGYLWIIALGYAVDLIIKKK